MKHETLTRYDRHSSLTYSEEDGKVYIGHHIDLDPHIKFVRQSRHIAEAATKQSNPNGHELVARIPIPMIWDWCLKNHYNMHQWAANIDGAKDKFMRYFLARDFSKLHNEHVTTKRQSSMVVR